MLSADEVAMIEHVENKSPEEITNIMSEVNLKQKTKYVFLKKRNKQTKKLSMSIYKARTLLCWHVSGFDA